MHESVRANPAASDLDNSVNNSILRVARNRIQLARQCAKRGTRRDRFPGGRTDGRMPKDK